MLFMVLCCHLLLKKKENSWPQLSILVDKYYYMDARNISSSFSTKAFTDFFIYKYCNDTSIYNVHV